MADFRDELGVNYSGSFSGNQIGEFYFLDGDDVATITSSFVYVEAGSGDDRITVISGGLTQIYGGAGKDTLIGGNSWDTLDGGTFDDVLAGNGGLDSLYGGLGADDLYGGDDEDELYGNEGQDELFGDNGNDKLYGGSGNDALRGGAGVDRMSGEDGNDNYEVTDIGDKVLEHADEGHDTIFANIDWTLSANVEDLILFGQASIDGTGTSMANGMQGNAVANILKGMAGNDVLDGATGNDLLDGGVGRDFLTGGANKDAFVFNTALSATTNVDTIADFSVADDTIRIDDAIFKSIAKTGVLLSGYLRVNNTGLAQDANDHIIYEKDTGEVYYDSNGTGAGGSILFAKISMGLALTNADFLVI